MKCSGGFNRHISDRLMDREQYAPPTPSWDYSPIDNMSGDPPATTPHPKKKKGLIMITLQFAHRIFKRFNNHPQSLMAYALCSLSSLSYPRPVVVVLI